MANCYNITTSLIPNSIEKEYIALVSPYEDHLIQVVIFGYQSKEAYFHIVIKDAENFIDEIPKIMDSKIKAVILRVHQLQNKFVHIIELKYTKAGYELVQNHSIHDMDESDEELGEKILGKNELQKIVFCSDKPDKPLIKTLKNILKAESKKFIFVDDTGNNKYTGAGVIEESKWIFNKKYTKFHVLPTTTRAYMIGFECGEEEFSIFMEDDTVALPFEKTVIQSKSSFNYFIGYFNWEKRKVCRLETSALGDDNYHEYEITLKVDVDNQPSYAVRGINVQQIIDFPSLCNEKMDDFDEDEEEFERCPVIGFYENHSFICIWDDTKEGYKFLDSWGGQRGKPMHIAFDKEKPYFGKAAEETFGKLGKFVVCDLLQVIIRTEEELQEYKHRSFTITKDDENPVLIEFDTFDGTKKAASPEFLMALLLKQHLKAIKKETGKKPNGLGFCILTDFDWEDIECINNCLEDACNLVKLGNYVFFD
uniref:Uncharacterized protein n=1 Tax=Panagrolaimus davidi TaxID=227884 RepID=A0A914NYU1_9BILA